MDVLTIARTFTAAAVVAGALSYSADGIEADQPGARTDRYRPPQQLRWRSTSAPERADVA